MHRKPTVLFVDPEKMARTMFGFRASLTGLPHFVVESAEAGVTILEEHRVDLVVTDLIMPKYDGVDLIRCMKEADLTRNIPIIVFTIGGNPQKLAEAVSAGATEVIMKQITPMDKLLERICAITDHALVHEAAVAP